MAKILIALNLPLNGPTYPRIRAHMDAYKHQVQLIVFQEFNQNLADIVEEFNSGLLQPHGQTLAGILFTLMVGMTLPTQTPYNVAVVRRGTTQCTMHGRQAARAHSHPQPARLTVLHYTFQHERTRSEPWLATHLHHGHTTSLGRHRQRTRHVRAAVFRHQYGWTQSLGLDDIVYFVNTNHSYQPFLLQLVLHYKRS